MPKATVTGKRQITIPLEICEKLNINSGDQIEFITEEDKVIFKKLKIEEEDMCPDCGKQVYMMSNFVTYNGRKYHMECWYDNHK